MSVSYGPRAEAVLDAAHELASQTDETTRVQLWGGFLRGIGVGLTLASLDPAWAKAALDELIAAGLAQVGSHTRNDPVRERLYLISPAEALMRQARNYGAT